MPCGTEGKRISGSRRPFGNGRGVEANAQEAAKWYRRAAEQGHAKAQFAAGNLYLGGVGVKADMAEARRWLQKAAEQGHQRAQMVLDQLGPGQ